MVQEHEIVKQVYLAKADLREADQFVRNYLPFIKAETAKVIHRAPREGEDDELCIAMFAFHEAVLSYDRNRGAFLPFAGQGIRNRLIDYYRKESRHHGVISLDQDSGDGTKTLLETVDQGKDEVELGHVRQATREEIAEFTERLADFELTLGDIAENCPKQERTLGACHQALAYARQNPDVIAAFLRDKKLPLTMLSKGSGVAKKTLERHRKYMVAILLAYTNGFEIIRGHLCQIAPKKGDGDV